MKNIMVFCHLFARAHARARRKGPGDGWIGAQTVSAPGPLGRTSRVGFGRPASPAFPTNLAEDSGDSEGDPGKRGRGDPLTAWREGRTRRWPDRA